VGSDGSDGSDEGSDGSDGSDDGGATPNSEQPNSTNEAGSSDAHDGGSCGESGSSTHGHAAGHARPSKRERPSPRFWTPSPDLPAASQWYSRNLPGSSGNEASGRDHVPKVPVVLFWGEADAAAIFPAAAAAQASGAAQTAAQASGAGGGGGLTLADCFALFATTETLPAADAWRCPNCQVRSPPYGGGLLTQLAPPFKLVSLHCPGRSL
jgi:hypothetical protein